MNKFYEHTLISTENGLKKWLRGTVFYFVNDGKQFLNFMASLILKIYRNFDRDLKKKGFYKLRFCMYGCFINLW